MHGDLVQTLTEITGMKKEPPPGEARSSWKGLPWFHGSLPPGAQRSRTSGGLGRRYRGSLVDTKSGKQLRWSSPPFNLQRTLPQEGGAARHRCSALRTFLRMCRPSRAPAVLRPILARTFRSRTPGQVSSARHSRRGGPFGAHPLCAVPMADHLSVT